MPTPVFTSPAAVTIDENAVELINVTATDASTYSISGGADAALFTIDPASGAIAFVSTPNFESPDDGNGDNVYELEITADDGTGNTATQTLTISVNDVQEGPPVLDGGATRIISIEEGQTAVGTFSATDPDTAQTLEYSIGGPTGGGDDAALFSIDPSTGELSFNSAPDFANPSDVGGDNIYNVNITVTDGEGGSDTQAAIITVTEAAANSAPVITSPASVNVDENEFAVTTVTATDADTDTVTFSITGGADAALFSIDANTGELTFNSAPNFEAPVDTNDDNIYEVEVTADDGNGGADTQTILAAIQEVNEPPVFSPSVLFTPYFEGQPSLLVAQVSAHDTEDVGDDGITYSIVGGEDAALFSVDPIIGDVSFIAAPDYEVPGDADGNNIYRLTVQATDPRGGIATQDLEVEVRDAAEISIPEGSTYIDQVAPSTGAISGTPMYSIDNKYDGHLMSIDPGTGALTFNAAPDYESPQDYSSDGVYNVQVRITGSEGGEDVQFFNVTVSDQPEVQITSNGGGDTASITADEYQTAAITTVTATEVGGSPATYAITGGSNAWDFQIDTNTGELTFTSPAMMMAEWRTEPLEVEVTATGGDGSTDTQTLAVTVQNVNSTPVIDGGDTRVVSVESGETAVTTVTATDADDDGITYSILSSGDSELFSIDPVTGELTFNDPPDVAAPGDSDGNNVYELTVEARDDNAAVAESDFQSILVEVTDPDAANAAPVITSDGGGASATVSINEGETAVTTVQASDADDDAVTYAITGGADRDLFEIDPATGELGFVTAPDYESPTDSNGNNLYEVQVQASDGNGGVDTQFISVTVNDVAGDEPNSAPEITSDGGGISASLTMAEGETAVTTVQATDADSDTLTYSIVGGINAAAFDIDAATGDLAFAEPAAPGTYEVQVQVADGNGGTDTQLIAITVDDSPNAAPDITSDGGRSIASRDVVEGNTSVTTVQASDADDDPITYSIVGGEDAGYFAIDASTGELSFVSEPDFEAPADANGDGEYQVTVQASDGQGGTDTQALTVRVVNDPSDDPNSAPEITSNGGGFSAEVQMDENLRAVTTVQASDADGDPITYSIVGGADAERFAIDAATGELAFRSAPDFEAPTDANGDNRYELEVQASDGHGGTDTQLLTVEVEDVDETVPNRAPVLAEGGVVAVDEGETVVTTLSASDPDGHTIAYSIAGGEDAELFRVNAATGELSFRSAPDYEQPGDADGNGLYEVQVEASDGHGGSDQAAVTVRVDDVDEEPENRAPTISTSNLSVAEGQTEAGQVQASDADGDTLTYAITGGDDAAALRIDAETGALSFRSAPDFEAPTDADGDNVYQVEVQVADGNGGVATQEVTVSVTDEPEAPEVDNEPELPEDHPTWLAGMSIAYHDRPATPSEVELYGGRLDDGQPIYRAFADFAASDGSPRILESEMRSADPRSSAEASAWVAEAISNLTGRSATTEELAEWANAYNEYREQGLSAGEARAAMTQGIIESLTGDDLAAANARIGWAAKASEYADALADEGLVAEAGALLSWADDQLDRLSPEQLTAAREQLDVRYEAAMYDIRMSAAGVDSGQSAEVHVSSDRALLDVSDSDGGTIVPVGPELERLHIQHADESAVVYSLNADNLPELSDLSLDLNGRGVYTAGGGVGPLETLTISGSVQDAPGEWAVISGLSAQSLRVDLAGGETPDILGIDLAGGVVRLGAEDGGYLRGVDEIHLLRAEGHSGPEHAPQIDARLLDGQELTIRTQNDWLGETAHVQILMPAGDASDIDLSGVSFSGVSHWVIAHEDGSVISGTDRGEVIVGQGGDDVIDGGAGSDWIDGGQGGADVLRGGEGADGFAVNHSAESAQIHGGDGGDHFLIVRAHGYLGADHIADFDASEGDLIGVNWTEVFGVEHYTEIDGAGMTPDEVGAALDQALAGGAKAALVYNAADSGNGWLAIRDAIYGDSPSVVCLNGVDAADDLSHASFFDYAPG